MSAIFREGPGFSPPYANTFALSQDSSSKYLDRTQVSGASRRIFTHSLFFKTPATFTGVRTATQAGIGAGSDQIIIGDTAIDFRFDIGGASYDVLTTISSFAASTWFHCLAQVDTTQAVDTNRVKIFIDGVDRTNTNPGTGSLYPPQNYDSKYGSSGDTEFLLLTSNNDVRTWDEMAYFDGSIYTYADVTSGGKPKNLSSLNFGANGRWMQFDTGLIASVGSDSSGLGNSFTNHNFVVGDFSTDVP